MGNRRNSTERRKKMIRLAQRYGWICYYCRTGLTPVRDQYDAVDPLDPWHPTIDHVIPTSKGGSEKIDNLVLSCFPCNHGKADRHE